MVRVEDSRITSTIDVGGPGTWFGGFATVCREPDVLEPLYAPVPPPGLLDLDVAGVFPSEPQRDCPSEAEESLLGSDIVLR